MRCLKWIPLALAVCLLDSLSFGAEVTVNQFPEKFLFSGRWEHGDRYSRTSAPAAMVRFNASASEILFELEGEARFRVDENGSTIAVFETGARGTYKVKTSGPGPVRAYRLIKISESNPGGVRLYKMSTDKSGEFAAPPKRENRRIEFIGDSFTVGFGDEGRNGEDESLVFKKTDASRSYAFLTADVFRADFQVNAFSGRGLVRNYDNIVPGWTVARLYEYTVPGEAPDDLSNGLPDASLRWDFGSFHPQVVVLFIGINDFQGNPPYGDKAAFKKAYAQLLDKLRGVHPGVRFLLLSTKVWPNDDLTPTVRAVYDAEISAGKTDLEFMVLQTSNVGLLGHPDTHAHEEMARAIRPVVGRLGGWLSR